MYTNAGIRVVTLVFTVQYVFMKARDPECQREIKRKNGEGLQRVCWCVWAQPMSFIGQMSCIHHKRWTLQRWEAVSPGIRSVGQQSTRPQGGLSGWLTGGMEPMCHVDLVWETERLVFICDSHACPVSLHSAANNLHFTSYKKNSTQAETHTRHPFMWLKWFVEMTPSTL